MKIRRSIATVGLAGALMLGVPALSEPAQAFTPSPTTITACYTKGVYLAAACTGAGIGWGYSSYVQRGWDKCWPNCPWWAPFWRYR